MRQERQLPKNIRQIGSPESGIKLYIEDFVITFLKMLAKDNQTFVRGAILFGKKLKIENQTVVFISGAMEGENIELDLDETVFDDQVWKEIYKKKELYFPDLDVMGWGLSRMGFSIRLNDKIKKTHFENFPGQGRVLYVVDVLEGEDAFYIYSGQDLNRQKGYYIYYEKNTQMQDYITDRKNKLNEMISYENIKDAKRDERIVRQFRKNIKEKRKKSKYKNIFRNVSSSAAVLLLCFMLGGMVYTVWGERTVTFKDAVNGAVSAMGNGVDEGMEDTTENEGTQKDTETTKKEKVIKEKIYVVKKGDKLMGISKSVYGSSKYTKNILKRNQMKRSDKIYPGQKLIIPSISN